MDQLQRIESKLDALLRSGNVTWQEPEPPAPPELSEAQKQALANAPVVKVPPLPGEEMSEQARAQAMANAPVVKVPGQEGAIMSPAASTLATGGPQGAAEMPSGSDIASVTVETEQPSGASDETTIPPAIPRRR